MKVAEEKFTEAAYRLFKQRGVRATRMQDVARACNTSLWDINIKYKSKKELVLAVVKHTAEKKVAYLLINASLSASAVTELNNFFQFVDDTISDFGAELFLELRRYHPLALDQLSDLVDNKLIPCMHRTLERGLNEGFFRHDLDSAQCPPTYFYILRTVLESDRDWTETRKSISYINDIFLHGVLNLKGMRMSTIIPT